MSLSKLMNRKVTFSFVGGSVLVGSSTKRVAWNLFPPGAQGQLPISIKSTFFKSQGPFFLISWNDNPTPKNRLPLDKGNAMKIVVVFPFCLKMREGIYIDNSSLDHRQPLSSKWE